MDTRVVMYVGTVVGTHMLINGDVDGHMDGVQVVRVMI